MIRIIGLFLIIELDLIYYTSVIASFCDQSPLLNVGSHFAMGDASFSFTFFRLVPISTLQEEARASSRISLLNVLDSKHIFNI